MVPAVTEATSGGKGWQPAFDDQSATSDDTRLNASNFTGDIGELGCQFGAESGDRGNDGNCDQ